MILDNEMWKIVLAARDYRGWAISQKLRETAKRVQEDLPIDHITRNDNSWLDDQFHFEGKDYTVDDLLAKMEGGSQVGVRFAELVYKTAQPILQKPRPLGISNYSDAIHKVTHPSKKINCLFLI